LLLRAHAADIQSSDFLELLMTTLWSCAGCPNGLSGFYRAIQENPEAEFSDEKPRWIRHVVIPAGRQFLFRRPAPPELLVLCEGWAFRFIQLPNATARY
jgi:hypothetical protein